MIIPEHLREFVRIKRTETEWWGYYIETYTVVPTDPSGSTKYSSNTLDDNTYLRYPELIKLIPRGFSILYSDSGNEVRRLDGLEKFDGSCPLDDDDENSMCDLTKVKEWKKVMVEFQEKANGKMAIFRIFEWQDELFIFGGSKNVHVLVPFHKEIVGTELHHDILRAIQKDEKNFHTIDETITGEYVDGKHIVYTNVPYMVYFHQVKNILPVQYEFPAQWQLDYIRSMTQTEGAVIKYTNLDTGEVFRQKHKSVWYVFIRSMRECLKRKSKYDEDNYDLIKKIFKQRSDDFLNLSQKQLISWYSIAMAFIKFMNASSYEFQDLEFTRIGIAVIFNEFELTEPDKFPTKAEPSPEELLRDPSMYKCVTSLAEFGIPVCVFMRGPAGSGKSTIAKKLEEYGISALHAPTGLSPKFVELITLKKSLCVDNMNLHGEYREQLEYAKNNGFVCIFLQTNPRKPFQNYKLVFPNYHGLFINYNLTLFKPVQKTPLHVTLFFGPNKSGYFPGQQVQIKIIDYVENKAGRCLKVDDVSGKSGLHITLETFEGYKPVNVGTEPTLHSALINHTIIPSIFSPMF